MLQIVKNATKVKFLCRDNNELKYHDLARQICSNFLEVCCFLQTMSKPAALFMY